MDDSIKGLTLGFLALLVLHGSLQRRARRDAEHQVRAAFHQTGTIRAEVVPRGMFGLLASDIWAVDLYGHDVRSDTIPFYRYPREGWKGSIRHLRLHLSKLTLAGLSIDRMEVDVPFVTYDLGEALYRDRLVIRDAGTGPVEVWVDEAGLESFLSKKYKHTLSDVFVSIFNNQLYLSATLTLFGAKSHIEASGAVAPRDGRFLDLVQPDIRINGNPAQSALIQGILSRINPVLDADRDLHMRGFLSMERVRFEGRKLVVDGLITIPLPPAPVVTAPIQSASELVSPRMP